jgi:putative ABC transport system permease protein
VSLLSSLAAALAALAANKLRSGLTTLGILFGVATVIAMIAVGSGARARVTQEIGSLGSNLIVVFPGSIRTSGVRQGSGSNVNLTDQDAEALAREVSGVRLVARAVRGSTQVVAGNENWATAVFGVTPEFFIARDWRIGSGRLFDQQQVDDTAKVALLGDSVARNLFGNAEPIGATVRIKNVPFEVVGVLAAKGQSSFGSDQDDVVFIPLTTARKRVFGYAVSAPRSVWQIAVKLHDTADFDAAEDDIKRVLRYRHRLAADDQDDFYVRNLADILRTQQEASRVLSLLLAAIASVSLLVGGVGIMNIMLVSVTERTREIGLRLAVGARPRDILRQFLFEAAILAAIGAVLGIGLGAGICSLLENFTDWQIELSAEAIALASGFAISVGVFFGYYPARRAARLSPIEALRYE